MPGDMGAGNQELARFLVVLASNFPMGVTGFGDAIVMHIVLTLCSLNFPGVCRSAVSEAVFNLTIGGLAAMAVQSALIWRDTNWKLVRVLLPPILLGTGLGLVLLYHIHSMWLKRALGLLFLSVGCYQLHGEVLRAKGLVLPPGRAGPLEVDARMRFLGSLLGLASGVLAGLFGTGGPPLMVFVSLFEVDKDEWRASNAVIWLVDNVFRFLYIYLVQGQIILPDDTPSLALLLLAGGAGVYAGSAVSAHVDMALFRRLLVLLLLLGANVMLFAGAPGRVALAGVASICGGLVLYVLALWNQPVWAPGVGGGKGGGGGGGGVLRRWLGGALYSRVALDEEEEEDGEEIVVDFQKGQPPSRGEDGEGDGERLERGAGGGEVELTAAAASSSSSSSGQGRGSGRREIHI